MKLSKVANQLEELPDDLRRSIVSLIDTKTEYDMEQVIGKMSQMESRLESQMAQTQQMESRLESQMGQMKDLTQTQMQQMRWFIGGAIAIVGILVPVILRLLH